jgi:flagellar operon protein
MKVDNTFFRHLEAVGAVSADKKPAHSQYRESTGIWFDSVLKEAESRILFSKHALKRLDERGIEITENQIDKLNSAIEMAQSKGIVDSLVLMDGKAFIINVPTNTVITVLDGGGDSEPKVFSNLNGAVIL